MKSTDNKHIYEQLAHIYDDLMSDISYEDWSDFIDEVIQTHFEDAETILELGCGTGTFALSLDELDVYEITATDFSDHMLDIAKTKADIANSNISFKNVDFKNIKKDEDDTYDAILLLFDSINYVHNEEELLQVFKEVEKVMHEDSIFIFDFTTPTNSVNAQETLDEEGVSGTFRYKRENRYLPSERLHYNEFIIEELDDEGEVISKYKEVHRQKIFTLSEIEACVKKAGFTKLAAYEGFDLVEANEKSDRITMVIK